MNDSGVLAESLEQNVLPAIEIVAQWSRFPWLRAGFSARAGGVSAIYGWKEQNLGWTAEDDPRAVAKNRRRFVSRVSKDRPMQLITLQQHHGDVILDMDAAPAPLMSAEGKATLQGDGMMTANAGRLLGIITADCVPVLVVDTKHRAVAAFHAGWRGTVARIVEQGIGRMRERYGSQPGDLFAAIGPAIGRCCFEVGDEVKSKFLNTFSYAPELIEVGEAAVHVDLHEANRRQLLEAGLRAEQITMLAECTACTRLPDGRRKYFSHRSERGFTGRMLSAVGISAE